MQLRSDLEAKKSSKLCYPYKTSFQILLWIDKTKLTSYYFRQGRFGNIAIYWDEAQAENILLMTNLDDLILLKWASRLVKTVNPQFSSSPPLTLLCKQKINLVVESFENIHATLATVGTVVLRTMTEEDSAIKCIIKLSTFPMSC